MNFLTVSSRRTRQRIALASLTALALSFTGLPVADVDAVRAAVVNMWPDEPGGWVHEWSELASSYLPRFVAGEAPRGPLAAFLAALSSSPPWR